MLANDLLLLLALLIYWELRTTYPDLHRPAHWFATGFVLMAALPHTTDGITLLSGRHPTHLFAYARAIAAPLQLLVGLGLIAAAAYRFHRDREPVHCPACGAVARDVRKTTCARCRRPLATNQAFRTRPPAAQATRRSRIAPQRWLALALILAAAILTTSRARIIRSTSAPPSFNTSMMRELINIGYLPAPPPPLPTSNPATPAGRCAP